MAVSVIVVILVLSLSNTALQLDMQPVKLSIPPPSATSSFKMKELLQAGYAAVDFTNIRTNYMPDRENVYYFVTRSEPDTAYPAVLGDEQRLRATHFEPAKKTVLIVHGWKGTFNINFCVITADAYLQAEDVNVIILDWKSGASGDYFNSVANTIKSGESASRFMNWLQEVTGSTPSNWHFIGHSLGGHQVGIIGRNVNGTVGYITSLDPAMPLWMTNNQRIRASDSAYTEVIHTNAGLAGYPMPLGHVDIYPNGGRGQPGCDGQHCNHARSFHLMAESLSGGNFEAVQCISFRDAILGSCNLPGRITMGGLVPKTGSTGVYYLKTKSVSPYSM